MLKIVLGTTVRGTQQSSIPSSLTAKKMRGKMHKVSIKTSAANQSTVKVGAYFHGPSTGLFLIRFAFHDGSRLYCLWMEPHPQETRLGIFNSTFKIENGYIQQQTWLNLHVHPSRFFSTHMYTHAHCYLGTISRIWLGPEVWSAVKKKNQKKLIEKLFLSSAVQAKKFVHSFSVSSPQSSLSLWLLQLYWELS